MDQPSQSNPASEKPTEVSAHTPASHDGKKNMKMIYVILGVVLVIAVVAVIAMRFGGVKKTQNTSGAKVLIGEMLPFSGGGVGSGTGEDKGIQLAKKQLEANNIELIKEDSKCDADGAKEAIKKLVAKKVVAIIGEACSSASLAALPIANENKIIMMSPSASNASLSIADDYFFRVVPPDDFQGKFMADLMYGKGIKKVSVLFTDDAYGTALNKAFQTSFEALGGKVVSSGSIPYDSINLTTQVAALKAAKPEAIYVVESSAPSTVATFKQVRAAGVTAPFYGADAIYDPSLLTDAKGAAEGIIVTSFSSGTKAFKQTLANAYPSDELIYGAPQAYDAFQALYLAIQKGATTGEEIKNMLPSIEFDGASGHIKFDKNGEMSGDYKYSTFEAKNGEFVPVEQ
jgi:branched-chain amino acid transport system substrate-binding protein